ncbi:MAG: TetR/AcrR family transcriptional regulator [Selenomonadaceae bacterium]|nr:TetR/AcrR family transcriptional regulator [Selenomonadaceae bacterium]MBR4695443.1 TetR/AcrR family transcriptional regulator [Selenomonadaceae bacterium]
MDRRQKKTRQAVFQAFTSLLQKKLYSKISVQEIIDSANIGRSTFYSHFETKDELLRALCTEIFDHVFSVNLSKEATHDFSAAPADLRAEITHILYHLHDSRHYIRSLLLSESGEMFMKYFKEYLYVIFGKEFKNSHADIPTEYFLNHIVCSFAETVRWWMNNERYSPEEICRFFIDITLPSRPNDK